MANKKKRNGAMSSIPKGNFTFRISDENRQYVREWAKKNDITLSSALNEIVKAQRESSQENFCKELRSAILTDEETQAPVKQIGRKIFDDCMREYERTIKEAINTSADKTLSPVSADDKQREDQALPGEMP